MEPEEVTILPFSTIKPQIHYPLLRSRRLKCPALMGLNAEKKRESERRGHHHSEIGKEKEPDVKSLSLLFFLIDIS
ncbi:hypothetical protein L1987_12690 [Smallanthus sonchifolius]|uniref:Uncharacterized protein n=1 Tax=Smallanthus sonchifolius TaxID=185202 RepID=A0ACB9JFA3_9ASTR|nr:hypothetical protein L1987_12690 [Smallanthus sonchifolius]